VQVHNSLQLTDLRTILEVMGEIAFLEAKAATKHSFKVVRPGTKHGTVDSDLLVRVKHKHYIVEVVEVAALYKLT